MRILFICLVVFLSACSSELLSEELRWAQSVCSGNGGIKRVFASDIHWAKAECSNGAVFQATGKIIEAYRRQP